MLKLAGYCWRTGISQVLFQMFPWGMPHFTIKLCCSWRHSLLQAPFCPAIQGKGELQPFDQVCLHQAYNTSSCSSSSSRCMIFLLHFTCFTVSCVHWGEILSEWFYCYLMPCKSWHPLFHFFCVCVRSLRRCKNLFSKKTILRMNS